MNRDEVYDRLIQLGCTHTNAVMRIAAERVIRDKYQREIEIQKIEIQDVLLELD